MAKGPDAFRTISEAAEELNVPQHVLRFWETKFSFIRPMKRAGGRRFYRPQDIVVLRGVKALLHDAGYTIKGVQKLHKEFGLKRLIAAASGEAPPSSEAAPTPSSPAPRAPAPRPAAAGATAALEQALADLERAKSRLDGLLKS